MRQSLVVAAALAACACSDLPLRTVSGTFKTMYWLDDGTKITVSSPPPFRQKATAILVPNGSSAGYATIPITLDSDQSFSLSNVPAGPYFLQLDQKIYQYCQDCGFLPGQSHLVEVVSTQLIELRADSPDLTSVTAARPDVVGPGDEQIIQMDVSGLAPWVPVDSLLMHGDSILTASSQANHYDQFAGSVSAGSTVAHGRLFEDYVGLPDASKHDVFYVYQRSTTPVGEGSGAGTVAAASRFARLNDVTMTQSTSSVSFTLTESAPQTGTVAADIRYSQFAALARLVHPTAVPYRYGPSVSVRAVPHSVEYPDRPSPIEGTNVFRLDNFPPATTDVNYGTLHYGEFLDPLWTTYQQVWFGFEAQGPNGFGSISSDVPMPAGPGPIVPVLGPPTQPRIEGRDAFANQNGVGLQPVITWSAPNLGHATSYQITITRQTQPIIAGETRTISAIVYGDRRFKIPPGFLMRGSQYIAGISARSAPWDTFDHGPFRQGVPFHTADCVTGVFSP